MLDRRAAIFPSEPRHLDAAERQLDRGDVVVVDPARSGLQLRTHALRGPEVIGEYAGGEPELGRIGASHPFVLIVELEHRHHRAKYLLAHDIHVVMAGIEHRWGDEETARQVAAGDARA